MYIPVALPFKSNGPQLTGRHNAPWLIVHSKPGFASSVICTCGWLVCHLLLHSHIFKKLGSGVFHVF